MANGKKHWYVGEKDQPIVDRLNELFGTKLTLQNYEDWFDGGETYVRFDRTVRKLFTKKQWKALEQMDGAPQALRYRLGFVSNSFTHVHGTPFDLAEIGIKPITQREIIAARIRRGETTLDNISAGDLSSLV